MNRISYVITLVFLIAGNVALVQKVDKTFQADTIFIYKEFKEYGTTSAVWGHHRDLDSMDAEKVLMSDEDLKKLLEITSRAKSKKLFRCP